MIERTLSIIKPDGVKRNLVGKIISHFEAAGLKVAGMELRQLSRKEAEGFYWEHHERGFFGELVDFMTSGPVVLMTLEGENAIARNRELMGATNPAQAAEGTIRKLYSKSIGENTVHGSDSQTAAAREVAYFFASNRIY